MVKDVNTKGNPFPELMAFGVIFLMIMSIVGIWWVSSAWANGESEQVYISTDSSTFSNQPTLNYSLQNNLNLTPSYYWSEGTPKPYNQSALTPVYTGNNTHTIALGTLSVIGNGAAVTEMPYELDDADTYLMDKIHVKINFSSAIALDYVNVGLIFYNTADSKSDKNDVEEMFLLSLKADNVAASISFYETNITLTLAQSIDAYQNALKFTNWALNIQCVQTAPYTGWAAHSQEYSIDVNGTYQKGVSTVTALTWNNFIFGGFFVFIGIAMTPYFNPLEITGLKKAKGNNYKTAKKKGRGK